MTTLRVDVILSETKDLYVYFLIENSIRTVFLKRSGYFVMVANFQPIWYNLIAGKWLGNSPGSAPAVITWREVIAYDEP